MWRTWCVCVWIVAAWSFRSAALAQTRESAAGESSAAKLGRQASLDGSRARIGPIGFNSELRLGIEGNDNVYRTERNRDSDVILRPEWKADAIWPISDLNALQLSLGVGYALYLDNTRLNSAAPLISPGTELSWHIFAGDFHIGLRERFSYLESLYIGSGASATADEFINFTDVARFRRLHNVAGISADWDLNDVIVTLGFDHEYFNALTRRFDYLDRQSEWVFASATFFPSGTFRPGVEIRASWNDYRDEVPLHDHGRISVGPFLEWKASDSIQVRAAAGYHSARFTGSGLDDLSTYYAYAKVVHVLNRFVTHSLAAGREHSLGFNADHLRTIYVRHAATWNLFRDVELRTHVSANFAEEFGTGFREEFSYYRAGLELVWLFHRDWRAVLDFVWLSKDSELINRDFHQNRLTVAAVYQF